MIDQTTLDELTDFDLFYYHGSNDLGLEIKSEVLSTILQSKRSLFYDRALDSCGATDYENLPNGLYLQVALPMDILLGLSKRNQYVSDGEGDLPERRIAISQNLIRIETKGSEVDVTVQYITLFDFKPSQTLGVPLGLGR